MPRTPRDAFQASAHRAPFERLAQTPEFEEACFTALLQLNVDMPDTPNSNCMDPHSQMVGARKVLLILATLGERIEDKPPTRERKLNYAAGV